MGTYQKLWKSTTRLLLNMPDQSSGIRVMREGHLLAEHHHDSHTVTPRQPHSQAYISTSSINHPLTLTCYEAKITHTIQKQGLPIIILYLDKWSLNFSQYEMT